MPTVRTKLQCSFASNKRVVGSHQGDGDSSRAQRGAQEGYVVVLVLGNLGDDALRSKATAIEQLLSTIQNAQWSSLSKWWSGSFQS